MTISFVTSNVSCNGNNNGSATATAINGNTPYHYLWSTGSSNATITSLAPGTYSVTVTDGIGCTTVNSVTITQPVTLAANASVTANENCFGGNIGSAQSAQ